MIVANDDGSGTDDDGVLEDDFGVGDGERDAATTHAFHFEYLVVLVEVHDEEMLLLRVVEKREEALVGIFRVLEFVVDDGFGPTATFAEFQGGHDGDGLGLSYAFMLHQIADTQVGKLDEVVVNTVEDGAREFHSRLFRVARSDEDGNQFGIAERRASLGHHLLAWPVVAGPFLDGFPLAGHVVFVSARKDTVSGVASTKKTSPT